MKKVIQKVLNLLLAASPEVIIHAEADEQRSFIQNKKQQRWLWYALDKMTGKVIACAFGKRTDDTLKVLLNRLKSFDVKHWFTDGWKGYQRLIPSEKHILSKKFTQGIERRNLKLRTRIKRLARRTICFSRSVEMHDKVIGAYLERYEF